LYQDYFRRPPIIQELPQTFSKYPGVPGSGKTRSSTQSKSLKSPETEERKSLQQSTDKVKTKSEYSPEIAFDLFDKTANFSNPRKNKSSTELEDVKTPETGETKSSKQAKRVQFRGTGCVSCDESFDPYQNYFNRLPSIEELTPSFSKYNNPVSSFRPWKD
ncbi:hypothetical protein Anas_13236, partial [Armadillidium nasatum]